MADDEIDDETAELIATLRAWMEGVMQHHQWSAERWASEAGIAGTTITRFLKDPERAIPSAQTLWKLQNAAGIPIIIHRRKS